MLLSSVHKEHAEVTWGHGKPLGRSAGALPLTQAHVGDLKALGSRNFPGFLFCPLYAVLQAYLDSNEVCKESRLLESSEDKRRSAKVAISLL